MPLARGEFVLVDLPSGPSLGFQQVDDPTPGKNRVHLDFHAADMEAEVAHAWWGWAPARPGGDGSVRSSTGWCSQTRPATRSVSRADSRPPSRVSTPPTVWPEPTVAHVLVRRISGCPRPLAEQNSTGSVTSELTHGRTSTQDTVEHGTATPDQPPALP